MENEVKEVEETEEVEEKVEETEELEENEKEAKDFLDEKIDNTEVFEKKWYNDLEKDKIIYSKRSIIAMLNKAFDPNNKDYKETHTKHPLFISIKSNGSFISDQFQVTKSIYIVNKNENTKDNCRNWLQPQR